MLKSLTNCAWRARMWPVVSTLASMHWNRSKVTCSKTNLTSKIRCWRINARPWSRCWKIGVQMSSTICGLRKKTARIWWCGTLALRRVTHTQLARRRKWAKLTSRWKSRQRSTHAMKNHMRRSYSLGENPRNINWCRCSWTIRIDLTKSARKIYLNLVRRFWHLRPIANMIVKMVGPN